MKCPECLEEVVEGDFSCPYCGASLEDELDCGPEEETGLASVLSASDEAEAYAIKDLLEGEGIPVIIRSHGNSQEKGDFNYSIDAWGEVLVNKVDLENSMAVIQKYMDTQRELLIQDEEEEEDEESL
jgi:hypothetical protein